ncbi:MAG: DegT/DnrJ/EryC1/StrS family aminotransferase [Deltaproteobacteria bacterium]|nr:DegT/DnrJ/EryC1/StrS family aminotransferase [Deltaproteobacteria bacterium]MCB9478655.1 DegT/DnrJ/EryC1/StrS family aminotransferase [Deltaproteobacteria bacterium]MCB9489814.1 DegT/DnrJ/EryC1/StrS family aminotransferase [Deltaproteobacteria bacterium]
MSIPFVDLAGTHARLRSELDAAVAEVLDTGQFILGPQVGRFEEQFAAYIGADYAVGAGSGMGALVLALLALQIGPGDEVIVPANTYIATALAVTRVGARPVLVDCDPTYYLIDPQKIPAAITEKTKAVIPVHLYGQCAPMDEINRVAKAHGLYVLEDAAQAHGATHHGRKAGTLGDIAAFSFYPGKNLGALGDGGAVTTNSRGLAERVRMLGNYGQSAKTVHDLLGTNSRLDSMQAALLSVKLPHLDSWNDARRRAAARYTEKLAGLPVDTPAVAEWGTHVFHLYELGVDDPRGLAAHLDASGIGYGFHYPRPVHRHRAYGELGYREGDFPVAERLCSRLISLPMHPELTDEQVDTVVAAVAQFVAGAQ